MALHTRVLSSRLFKVASLSTIAYIGSQILRFGSNLILTRILAPEVFGLMSIVLVVQMTLHLLSDVGLRTSIIQSPRGEEPEFLNTVWTLQVIRGFAICGVSVAIAVGLLITGKFGQLPAGSALASPQLPALLVVSALAAIIGGFQSTNLVTATRKMNVKQLIIVDGAAQIGGLLVMIALAIMTRSIWALVAGGLASTLITTALSLMWIPGIRNTFAWEPKAREEIYKFGIWVLLSSTTYVLAGNIDRIILSGLVTAATLGLYSLALNLSSMIEAVGSRLFELIVLPYLSEVARQDRNRFRQTLLRFRVPFDLGYTSVAGLLYALGPSIVSVLYDRRYHEAGEMLQILSFSLLFARYGLLNFAYLALGHSRWMAIINCAKLLSLVTLFLVLFKFFGFTVALYGIAFHVLPVLPLFFFFNQRYGLNSLALELLVLLGWPVGFLAGQVFIALISLLIG